MSKRSLYLLPFLLLGGLLLSAATAADPPVNSQGARLATYDQSSGESFFALSLTPRVNAEAAKAQELVVLVDTSASQVGLYRDDTLAALDSLVSRLDDQATIRLFAVDLTAVPMSDGFVKPRSPEWTRSLEEIELASATGLDGHGGSPACCGRLL